jgi:hypothetical protein
MTALANIDDATSNAGLAGPRSGDEDDEIKSGEGESPIVPHTEQFPGLRRPQDGINSPLAVTQDERRDRANSSVRNARG